MGPGRPTLDPRPEFDGAHTAVQLRRLRLGSYRTGTAGQADRVEGVAEQGRVQRAEPGQARVRITHPYIAPALMHIVKV